MNFLKNIKISKIVIVGMTMAMLAMILIAAIGISSLSTLQENSKQLTKVSNFYSELIDVKNSESAFLIEKSFPAMEELQKTLKKSQKNVLDLKEKIKNKQIRNNLTDYNKLLEEYLSFFKNYMNIAQKAGVANFMWRMSNNNIVETTNSLIEDKPGNKSLEKLSETISIMYEKAIDFGMATSDTQKFQTYIKTIDAVKDALQNAKKSINKDDFEELFSSIQTNLQNTKKFKTIEDKKSRILKKLLQISIPMTKKMTLIAKTIDQSVKSKTSSSKRNMVILSLVTLVFGIIASILILLSILKGLKTILSSMYEANEAIDKGNTSYRIEEEQLTIDFVPIAKIFNKTVELFSKPIQITMGISKQMAEGNITNTIENNFKGDFGEIINSLNNLIEITNSIIESSEKIAEGDLKVKITPRSENDKLLISMKKMVQNTKNIVIDLTQNIQTMAAGSEELSAISMELSSNSENIDSQMKQIANASGELSSTINGIASASEEVSINSANVAQNAQQMADSIEKTTKDVSTLTKSIKEVKQNSSNALQIAENARTETKEASELMSVLKIAANEIDKVTDMIKEIAGQTNLLALNATIEAASAGEAGKGFAVVANEIKELARQSAKAAEDIADKINDVQQRTDDAVNKMGVVEKIVEEIDDNINEISKTVDKQADMANNVNTVLSSNAKDIKEVAKLVSEITVTVNELSQTTGEGARATQEVGQIISNTEKSTAEVLNGSKQVNTASIDLAEMAEKLSELVDRFKI